MTAAYPLPPISDADWPEEIADMTGGFAGKLNVYRPMAHDPALLRAWTDLRQHVVLESALGLELVEVVILRTGVRLNSRYEWQQHISRARKVGFRSRSKTVGGRRIIKRKRKRSGGYFRVG